MVFSLFLFFLPFLRGSLPYTCPSPVIHIFSLYKSWRWQGSEGPFVTKKGFFSFLLPKVYLFTRIFTSCTIFYFIFFPATANPAKVTAVSPHAANATKRAEKNILSSREEGRKEGREKNLAPPLLCLLFYCFCFLVWCIGRLAFLPFFLTLFIGRSYLISYKISRLPIALKFGNGSGRGLISVWKSNVLFYDGEQLACSTLLCFSPLCSPEQMGSE